VTIYDTNHDAFNIILSLVKACEEEVSHRVLEVSHFGKYSLHDFVLRKNSKLKRLVNVREDKVSHGVSGVSHSSQYFLQNAANSAKIVAKRPLKLS